MDHNHNHHWSRVNVDEWPKTMCRSNICTAMSKPCVCSIRPNALEQEIQRQIDPLIHSFNFTYFRCCMKLATNLMSKLLKHPIPLFSSAPKVIHRRFSAEIFCEWEWLACFASQVRWQTHTHIVVLHSNQSIYAAHSAHEVWAWCGRPYVVQAATGKFNIASCLWQLCMFFLCCVSLF